ncbi:unnamed protein product [Porites lobata]|uniref:Uncharacterized protein n=1 Tax=Porites lobata TaxID=104759 RepID=A0ABN8MR55_9CNID|nr:unnamed protein product [Porites lobata]
MDPQRDGFYVELTFVKRLGRGGKNGGKKANPSHHAWEKLAKKKSCVVTIQNKDNICLVRAIVTMKERAKYSNTPHVISLVKHQDHFDGLTSIPALINRSYYCRLCDKGYDVEGVTHHNCCGQNCPSYTAQVDGFEDPMVFQNENDDENEEKGPPPPPVLNFADIECSLTEERVFIPNLICWSSEEDDELFHSDSIEDFLQALEDLTEVEGDERPRKELLKYCESDVKQLKEGCLKFVAEFEEIAGFNPLVEAVTIASACNLFWRREKLETDLIALEPQGGWRRNRINQSKIALEWLYYQDHLLGGMGRVRHVRNGGEVQVGNPDEMVYVDGYDETTHTVFEFYGCFYHRCPRCLKRHRNVRRNCHADRTVNEVYEAIERKAAMLRPCGYHVVEKWECEFQEENTVMSRPFTPG